ncbi:hypothetical protein EU513_11480 [Yimella sp. RIT 621]|uniref:type IV toxin-antitoxin system AbiEi family antitoxin domain-containing protein n=1 Tax=Yimella sp. RIT 621 TaxID=2510323 RepID=UPI00101D0640|nr:type IV toxin-antitoxin system AbiEi family antitoxin domain-containing protein [Yimella sp. RIT 621]RYG76584.1 hypothetical protein EU513_11480 [Yimella sp. RIT 621]
MDVVSWEEVESRGLGARDVRRLVATGEWTRLRRGWFATRAAADDEDAQVVEQIDRRHESPGETLTALQLRLAGVAYEPQFDVPDSGQWTPAGRGYRADVRVIGHNVLIEFDGKVTYENGDSVFQEKKREDHLRSLGWIVVRVVWSDLKIPGRVATLVREAVAQVTYKGPGYVRMRTL